jgi:hypothetical protein
MIPDLPKLAFIRIDDVVFHEYHDDTRTQPLIERIRESGLFRNPPIATPLHDDTSRYMLLDGANRVSALRDMGFPDVLVQVVEAETPGLKLENWNHVLWEMEPARLLTSIRDIPNINLLPTEECDVVEPNLWGDCGLALVQVNNGHIYTTCTPETELVRRVHLLNEIVDCYKDRAHLDRTGVRCIDDLRPLYPHLCGLIVFPLFDIQSIMRLAAQGFLLPAGITRFTVSPRALHINYPLYELAADRSLEEKNAALSEWVQKRIARRGVRYYEEATFLFDE